MYRSYGARLETVISNRWEERKLKSGSEASDVLHLRSECGREDVPATPLSEVGGIHVWIASGPLS